MNHLRANCHRSVYWRRLVWVILCVGTFLGLPTVTSAEEIAILNSADIQAYSETISAFTSALPSSLHITREYNLQGDMEKGRTFARRIRTSNAKVVLAVGLKAALAAKLEIPDIPIIFCLVFDPEKYGLPTANMVGLSLTVPFRQHLQTLHALAPKVSRLGVLFDPKKTHNMHSKLLRDAKALGIKIFSEEVHREQDVASALHALKDRIDALWLLPDSTVLTENTLDFLMSTTLEANIPLVGFSAALVRSGAVVGAYFRYADIGKQAAKISQQLVEQPSSSLRKTLITPDRVHQSINQKSARYLSFSLTPDVVRQFDEQF
jgi:putative tryptophan/tyrosine transport system substrate-binding protein